METDPTSYRVCRGLSSQHAAFSPETAKFREDRPEENHAENSGELSRQLGGMSEYNQTITTTFLNYEGPY